MAKNNFNVGFVFGAKKAPTFDKTFGGINKALGGLAKTAGAAFAGVAAGAKVLDFGKQSVESFRTFEKGISETFTLLPELSTQAQGLMANQAKSFSKSMGVLPEETNKALYQALSASVPQDTVFDFLKTSNKAAIGGIATLEDSVGALSTVVNNYGQDVISADKASDLMFTTVKKGVTSFPELATALGNVLPSAAAANVSFEQVSAGMATLTAVMGKDSTATAVTSLRSVMDELSNSSTATSKKFQALSGKTFSDFMASGGTIADVMDVMSEGAKQSGVAVADMFSSVESKKAVNIFSNNADMLISNLSEMSAASGATEKAFQTMDKTFDRKMAKASAYIEVIRVGVGEKLVDAFLFLWDKAEPFFSAFETGGFSGGIEKMFGSGAGEAAKQIETFVASMGGGLKKLFSGDIVGGTGDIMSLLGLDSKSAEAVTQMIFGVSRSFDKLAQMVQPVVSTIGNAIKKLMPTFSAIGNFLVQNIMPAIRGVFDFIVNKVVAPAVAFFQANIPKISNVISNVWTIIQPVFQNLCNTFKLIWNIAQPIISGLITTFQDLASKVWTVLSGVTDFIAGIFTGNWSKAWQGVKDIFSGVFEGLASIVKAPINAVISLVNGAINGINSLSIDIPDWVPEWAGGGKHFGLSIPQIPMLAQGGIATSPTLAMIGEGKEKEAVLPLSKLNGMLDANNTTQVINMMPLVELLKRFLDTVTGASAATTITFAPVINIAGDGDPQKISDAMQEEYQRFKQFLQQYERDKKRTAFAV